VRNIVKLARTSAPRYAFNLWLWKRVMRSRAARDEVVPMLDAVFNPNPGQRRRAPTDAPLPLEAAGRLTIGPSARIVPTNR
jgi:hypothetical protein